MLMVDGGATVRVKGLCGNLDAHHRVYSRSLPPSAFTWIGYNCLWTEVTTGTVAATEKARAAHVRGHQGENASATLQNAHVALVLPYLNATVMIVARVRLGETLIDTPESIHEAVAVIEDGDGVHDLLPVRHRLMIVMPSGERRSGEERRIGTGAGVAVESGGKRKSG